MQSRNQLPINFQGKLKLDSKQRDTLEELFAGPAFLQRRIMLLSAPITRIEEAEIFLDLNWRRLSSFMFEGSRQRSPKQLTQLILDIATSESEVFALDFPSCCRLTPDNKVLISALDLGPLSLENPDALKSARADRYHLGAFALLMAAEGYEVSIDFFPKSTSVIKSEGSRLASIDRMLARNADRMLARDVDRKKADHKAPKALGKKKKIARMSATDFIAAFDGWVAGLLRAQMEVSRSFSTTRFSELEGRVVSGGLPSLPRRR